MGRSGKLPGLVPGTIPFHLIMLMLPGPLMLFPQLAL